MENPPKRFALHTYLQVERERREKEDELKRLKANTEKLYADKQREFYRGPKSLADLLNDQKHLIKPVLDLKLWRFPRARRPQNTSYLPQTTDSSDWI